VIIGNAKNETKEVKRNGWTKTNEMNKPVRILHARAARRPNTPCGKPHPESKDSGMRNQTAPLAAPTRK